MKKIKFYLSFIAIFALLFTSCSKDEGSSATDSDKASLSFGAILENLANKSSEKQSAIGDMPECSDGTPAYVEIVLMQGENEVVGTAADPYRVDLVAGQVFTKEDAALELTPGTYTLNNFAVYNAEGDLLWLAPRGGALAQFVDTPLPIDIELGAGVKKYVDVSVLCYDDRDVNLYGYQFFELDINEAFEFCFFANYCTPEGRHFPARYSVDLSIDGTTLYEGVVNNTGRNDDGDLFADALCFALPNLEAYEDNEEYIDYTLTLLDWTEEDDAYGDVAQTVITGSLSRAEIMANFDGDDDVEYEHFRFGCGDDEPSDADNDGIPDTSDECPNEAGPASNNGCPVASDTDGDGVLDGDDDCPNTPSGATVDANGCPIDSDGDGVYDGIDECPNEVGPASNTGCPVEGDADGDGILDGSDNCPDTPSGATVDANGCPMDSDGDGVYDGIDQCANTETGVEVDAVGCPIIDVCEIPAPASGCSVGWLEGSDAFVVVNSADDPLLLELDGNVVGTVRVTIDSSGSLVVGSILTASSSVEFSAYEVWVSSSSGGSVVASACAEIDDTTLTDELTIELGDIDASYPYYIRMKTNLCPVTE